MAGKPVARRGGLRLLCLGLMLASVSCPVRADDRPDLTITNVTVVPMTGQGTTIPHATVRIAGGRIVGVAATAPGKARCPGTCIDGTGKWLIPGLTDAHVHLENDHNLQLYMGLPERPEGAVQAADVFLPYVAHGVTQVFDLSSMPETLLQKADIKAGRVVGPNIVTAYMLDGPKPMWPEGMSHGIPDPEAGRQAVRDAATEGYDLIKVYSLLDLPTFLAIVDEAKKRGLKVIGHIPGRNQGMTQSFLVPGFDAVAHAEEFAFQTAAPDASKIHDYIAMVRASHTALVSTLTVDDQILAETADPDSLKRRGDLAYINPVYRKVVVDHNPYVAQAGPERIAALKAVVAFNRQLVKAFSDAGVPILAGTDSLVPGVAPGFALPDELEALKAAGLTPYQALYSATRAPCEWLGKASECGSVEPGKRADLVLLDADPTVDISNVRKISAVIIKGKVQTSAQLDRRMSELKTRFAATPQ